MPDKVDMRRRLGAVASLSVWLTVHVPGDAAAGDYSGTMPVSVCRTKIADVPVRLTSD